MSEQDQAEPGCCECGDQPADTQLSGHGPLCDRCADTGLAAATGWPRLPEVPGPVVLTGPDGRSHRLRYRFFRAGTGISLRLQEITGPHQLGGYEFGVLGEHDADISDLAAAVYAEAHAVVVDGRYLPWDELGASLSSFEGWRFRLTIEEP